MKVLITGVEGFIGRHLRHELLQAGHDVYGSDKTWPDDDREFEPEHFYFADLLDEDVADMVIGDLRPDAVIHLAAQVGRLFGEADVKRTIESNALMTTYVAQATARHGARLVYASTSEVYGDQAHVACNEISGPFTTPHNIYGLSKRWGEETAFLYAPRDLQVLRFSMPYGPGVPPGRGRAALPNILWQAVNGLEIPIHIGAERSWCWIGDTVRAVRMIVEKGVPGPYNVGRDDDAVSMLYLADKACEMIQAPRTLIKPIPAPDRQTVVKRLETQRIRDLGWKPEVGLEEGMARVLEWVSQFDGKGQRIPVAA